MDPDTVFSRLLADRQGNPARIASSPGVFAAFVQQANCLPRIDVPATGLIYIGEGADVAERSPFVAAGRTVSTPWRTLGAILRERLSLTAEAGTGGQAVRHYRFADPGEERLREWICRHLLYSAYPIEIGGKAARVELKKALILAHEPPLNQQHWDNPQGPKIAALKRVCSDQAEQSR